MEIYTSVRNLVEFIMRCGDIDNRKAAPEDAMQEGSRIHRMIQRRMGSDYRSEVPLQYTYHTEKYDILVEGRADGIIGGLSQTVLDGHVETTTKADSDGHVGTTTKADSDGHVVASEQEKKNELITMEPDGIAVIDEIKGTYRDLEKMKEPVPVHLAQAKCYAFMYADENGLSDIRVRMTYCNMETEEIRYFHYDYTYREISNWFEDLMMEYRKWADYTYEWNLVRQESIHNTEFPFPYRPGQKELVSYVYQTIYHKKKLFIEAPTGVGKTISTVFPAVKAVGEGQAEKIFYLTAKTITRTVAEEAFSLLREHGLSFKTVILTAKEKICFTGETECNPVACPYAKGHYDRINDAIYDMLTHEVSFTRGLMEQYAEKHQVCPFEMCLDMSLFADGVICDYNYVFDPHAYLRRFFAEGVSGSYLFLVDEAHNLLDRGREMYSAVLRKEDFLECKRVVKLYDNKMAVALEKCNRNLLQYKKECENYQVVTNIESFILSLNRLAGRMEEFLEKHDDSPVRKEVLEFYFEVSHFLLIYDKMDGNYVMYTEMESDGSFILKLFCVNPAKNLQECMQKGRSTILFSATLLPIQYHKRLLGGTEEDYEVYAHSIFDPKKRGLMIGTDVTSKYTRRGYDEYRKIAFYIKNIISGKPGNYMIFFPSHAFLRQVYDIYLETFWEEDKEECLLQEEYMKEEQREAFLSRFKETKCSTPKTVEITFCEVEPEIFMEAEEVAFAEGEEVSLCETGVVSVNGSDKTLLGFCVMGGIFGEGIDLKHDSLIGVIVVGTGLPQVCNEREIMKQFFDEESGNGFDYAYQYPGMNKVLQAAGRVIRTSEDVGIVALLDERFLQRRNRQMFPREWSNFQTVNQNTVSSVVQDFWEKQEKR